MSFSCPHSRWINATRNELCILFGIIWFSVLIFFFDMSCLFSDLLWKKKVTSVANKGCHFDVGITLIKQSCCAKECPSSVNSLILSISFTMDFNACKQTTNISVGPSLSQETEPSACEYVSRVALFTRGLTFKEMQAKQIIWRDSPMWASDGTSPR